VVFFVASEAKLGRPTEEYSAYFEGGRPTIRLAQQKNTTHLDAVLLNAAHNVRAGRTIGADTVLAELRAER
jgi:hypothetical protein